MKVNIPIPLILWDLFAIKRVEECPDLSQKTEVLVGKWVDYDN